MTRYRALTTPAEAMEAVRAGKRMEVAAPTGSDWVVPVPMPEAGWERWFRIGYRARVVEDEPQPSRLSDAALELVRDLAKEGLRFDLNPCHDMSSQETSETFWHRYFRRADASIRERALCSLALAPPQPSPVQGDGDPCRTMNDEAWLAFGGPIYIGPPKSRAEVPDYWPLVEQAASEIERAYPASRDEPGEPGAITFTEHGLDLFVRALAATQPGGGFVVVPKVGTRVCASHPITCLNPEPSFIVSEVKVEHGSFYARGENTCWFGVGMLAAAPKQSQEGG